MNTWTPLWSGIVDSSLWEEDGDVVKVFMTILATKDSDHVCRLDAYRIGRKCKIDELRILEILKLLASPDKRRKSKQEYEGRRIKLVEDGWLVLNGEIYRKMVQDEMRKARWRKGQAAARERKKAKMPPDGAQDVARRSEAAGDTQAQTDAKVQAYYDELDQGCGPTSNGSMIRRQRGQR